MEVDILYLLMSYSGAVMVLGRKLRPYYVLKEEQMY